LKPKKKLKLIVTVKSADENIMPTTLETLFPLTL
jgi:hypothetical protein